MWTALIDSLKLKLGHNIIREGERGSGRWVHKFASDLLGYRKRERRWGHEFASDLLCNISHARSRVTYIRCNWQRKELLHDEAIMIKNTKPKKVTLRLKGSAKQSILSLVDSPAYNIYGLALAGKRSPHLRLPRKNNLQNSYNANKCIPSFCFNFLFFPNLLFLLLHIHGNKQLSLYNMAWYTSRFRYPTTFNNRNPLGLWPKFANSNCSRMVRSDMGKDRLHIWRDWSWLMSNWGLWWKAWMWWHWCHSTRITLWDNPRLRQWQRFLRCQHCRWLQSTSSCLTCWSLWRL